MKMSHIQHADYNSESALISLQVVAHIVGTCKKSCMRYADRGEIPPPAAILGGTRRWRRKDIEDFVNGTVRKVNGQWVRVPPPVLEQEGRQ